MAAAIAAAVIVSEGAAQFTPGRSAPPEQRGEQLTADQLVDVRAVTDRTRVCPGETFHVLAVFDIKRPWHLYWKNPGEAGALPPSIDITAPVGFTVGEMRWPRPRLINSPAGEMFSYENQLALFVPITAPAELEGGEFPLEMRFRYAVCDANRCLIGQGTRGLTIHTTNSATGNGSDDVLPKRDAELIERHLRRLPRDIEDTDGASIVLRDEQLTITVPAHGNQRATFFELAAPGVTYGRPEMRFEDDSLTITIALTINPNNFRGGPPTVGGLVALGREADGPSYEGSAALSP